MEMIKHLQYQPVNPGDPIYQNTCVSNQMDYWCSIVDSCAAIFFTRYHGVITAGVGKEVLRAISQRKPAWELIVRENRVSARVADRYIPVASVEFTRALLDLYKRQPQEVSVWET